MIQMTGFSAFPVFEKAIFDLKLLRKKPSSRIIEGIFDKILERIKAFAVV